MGFSQPVIDLLANTQHRKQAIFYNSLAVGIRYKTVPMFKWRALQLANTISAQVKDPEIQAWLKDCQSELGVPYSSLLTEMLNHVKHSHQLNDIIQTLKILPQSNKTDKFIHTLEACEHEVKHQIKSFYNPGGLYGCLVSAERALKYNPLGNHTKAFEFALLTGISLPILDLFNDMEKKGDLDARSLKKLELARKGLIEANALFKAKHEEGIQACLDNYFQAQEVINAKSIQKHLDQLSELSSDLSTLEHDYQEQFETLNDQERSLFSTEIEKLKKEIESIQRSIDRAKSRQDEFTRKKALQYKAILKEEAQIINYVFSGVNQELSYIEKRIKAIESKKAIEKQYGRGKPRGKNAAKGKQRAMKALKKETGLGDIISEKDAKSSKKYIEKFGGELLYYLNQSSLAAMGNSEGLCAGYSSEFLLMTRDKNWDDLTFEQKMKRFKPKLRVDKSFTLNRTSSETTVNALYMHLESGLRWDIQSNSKFRTGAELFMMDGNDTSYAKYKTKSANVLAFYKTLTHGILKADDGGTKRIYIRFSKPESGGHVIGLTIDNDGYLLHDSNTGYIRFKNRNDFEKFLPKYLAKTYEDLVGEANVFDFDRVCKNIEKFNLNPLMPQETVIFDDTTKENDKRDMALEHRTQSARRSVSRIHQLLKAHSQNIQIQPPIAQVETNQPSHAVAASSSEETLTSEDSNSEIDYDSTRQSTQAPTPSKAPKNKSITLQRQNAMTKQQWFVQQSQEKSRLNQLIDDYIQAYDGILDEKPVLKQRLMIILNELKDSEEVNSSKLEELDQICKKYSLPKCEDLRVELDSSVKQSKASKPSI